jgi:hypothetical protein
MSFLCPIMNMHKISLATDPANASQSHFAKDSEGPECRTWNRRSHAAVRRLTFGNDVWDFAEPMIFALRQCRSQKLVDNIIVPRHAIRIQNPHLRPNPTPSIAAAITSFILALS